MPFYEEGREKASLIERGVWGGEEQSMQREQQCESPEVQMYRAGKNSKGPEWLGQEQARVLGRLRPAKPCGFYSK